MSYQAVSGAVPATTDATGSTQVARLQDRRGVRVFAKVSGGTANVSIVAGLAEAAAVPVATQSSVGTSGKLIQTDAGPFPYVAIAWDTNTGTLSADATALPAL